jgi:ABC-type Na+ efflux pump permease subunit
VEGGDPVPRAHDLPKLVGVEGTPRSCIAAASSATSASISDALRTHCARKDVADVVAGVGVGGERPVDQLPLVMVSVVGGLLIYNTFFALLGSLISRPEDASQVSLPIFIPIMAGYLVGQAAIFGDAETSLVRVLSLFPLTSPMLLPVRVARDAIAPWEVALSVGLLALGVWLLIRISGRVYEFTLLHTGSRVGWGQLLRLSRGAVIG